MAPCPCVLCSSQDYQSVLEVSLQCKETPRTFHLLQCRSCGLVKTDPHLSKEELATYYPRDYYGRARPEDLDWLRRDQRHRTGFLEQFLREGRVLDVGCGLGLFLLALDPARWERYGLEAMPVPYTEASRLLGADRVLWGDLETARLPNEHFDAITFWDVLEHVPNPHVTLEAAYHLVRPGGFVCVTTPNFAGYQARAFGEDWYALSLPHHLYHYTPATMKRLLQAAGFRLRSLEDCFGDENYHSLKHSLLASLTRRHGRGGRWRYYVLKPFLHPWEWLSTLFAGGSHLAICAQRPPT